MYLFKLYRQLLTIVVAVYAVTRLTQSILSWRARLRGDQGHVRVMRGYVVNMLVSIRILRFWRELLEIAVLVALLVTILYAHKYFWAFLW